MENFSRGRWNKKSRNRGNMQSRCDYPAYEVESAAVHGNKSGMQQSYNEHPRNTGYDQQRNVQYRSFHQGREESCRSLSEQQARANYHRYQRGNRRFYSNQKSKNYNSYDSNDKPPNYKAKCRTSSEYGSDNESVSSSTSYSEYSRKSTEFNPSSGYSLNNVKSINIPSYSTDRCNRDILPNEDLNYESNYRKTEGSPNDIKTRMTISSHDRGINHENDFEKAPPSVLQDTTKINRMNSGSVFEQAKVKVTELLSVKEDYEKALKCLKPSDIIMNYRHQIDNITKEYVTQNLKKIEKFSSVMNNTNECSEILKLHRNNLIQQQRQFDDCITKIKMQLSVYSSSNLEDILKYAEALKVNVQYECKLFQRSLPGYGLKSNILNSVKETKVTIISADYSYFLNIVTPLLIRSEFPDHFITSCETSELSRTRLQKNVCILLNEEMESDLLEKQNTVSNITFISEDKILSFSNDCLSKKKNLFFVINMCLKRTIVMDLLLANLCDLLMERNDINLVILISPYDCASKYENYFSRVTSVSVVNAPQLTLPVKTVWKNFELLPVDNYVDEVVRTVMAIHTLEDRGDVIAFLPTVSDAKSASVNLNKRLSDLQLSDVECVLIHERSSDKSHLDLLYSKKHAKRTIFFVTNCEEVLAISSVCFVIDSGLKRDYIFDSSKKQDILVTTFNSQARARLRKSLAGAFGEGVCYRLYNKENYSKEMPSIEYPEVLTVNPFNTLIKIFQHRPTTATTMQMVEPLPKDVKDNALKLLKKCDAIRNENLTAVGENLVKLPFPVKYSKLILLGIQWGIAYEAIVLVAFFSVPGRLFKYPHDSEQQMLTDAAKLQLVHNDSDTMSYLYIFKIWLENDQNSLWCEKHHINFDTLKRVYAKVTEICDIASDSLKENIIQEFSNIENCATYLLEMLFECFQDNLCVFTGHYRSGYRVLSSHCIAFLHPSSMISSRENLSEFIIFDHMESTSRDFLVGITTIPHDLVNAAVEKGTLEFDYSNLFENRLVKKIIEPVGERVIKQVFLGKKGKKLKEIEDKVKLDMNSESIVIEPSVEKGCISVYALKDQIEHAVVLINEIIKSKIGDILNMEQTHILELKRGQIGIPIEVKWTKGAMVSSVKSGACSQGTVKIQNNLENENNKTNTDTLYSIQYSINLIWTRRLCKGSGFITFKNYEQFMRARRLSMKYHAMLGTEVFIQLSKTGENQLYISELPPCTSVNDLKDSFENLLGGGIEIEKVELKYLPPFETSENELQEVKSIIEKNCQKFTNLSDFDIIIPKPKQTATIMKAYINVGSDVDLQEAAEHLSNSKIGNLKVSAKPVYRSVIKCSIEICRALKGPFEDKLSHLEWELKWRFQNEDLFNLDIDVIKDIAVIKLLANRGDIMELLQRTVNDLLEGEILNRNSINDLHKLFCHGGHVWLRTLEKIVNVYIIEDYKTKTIRLYGSSDNCHQAKKRIMQFLEDTENEAISNISLSTGRNNRMLLKAVIMKYGVNLEKFIEFCKLRSAVLDIKSCHILLHGNRESIEMAEESLRLLSANVDSSYEHEVLSSQEKCPVCACPALNLTFRLEYCGHLYCCECIQGLVEQAQFPIKCCAEDCYKEIVLDDISKILGEDTERIKKLLDKSMKNYIEKHKAEILYCPAPDCSMFFYKNEVSGSKWNCPLCQNEICIKCNVVFHQGYTCEMYQGSKTDPDYSFNIWKKTSTECKRCPRCNTAIEKNKGCDHMTCISCAAHFCWICVREFPTARDVYNHIPYCDKYPKW